MSEVRREAALLISESRYISEYAEALQLTIGDVFIDMDTTLLLSTGFMSLSYLALAVITSANARYLLAGTTP